MISFTLLLLQKGEHKTGNTFTTNEALSYNIQKLTGDYRFVWKYLLKNVQFKQKVPCTNEDQVVKKLPLTKFRYKSRCLNHYASVD